MKMNKLRLTNVIENHFYLDFNWKDDNDDEMALIDMHFDMETMTFSRIAYDTEPMD